MRLHVIVTALPVIIAIAAGAAVAQKTTVDPNAKENAGSLSSHLLGASERITLDAPNLTLTALINDASKQAGTYMHPSDAPEDWQPRERTVTVFARNLKASEFRHELADLLGYEWLVKTYTDKRKEYILHETLSARQAREKCVSQVEAQYEEWRVDCIDAASKCAATSQDLTQKEISSARKDDPWLYYLSSNAAGQQWAQVLQTMPVEWQNSLASAQGRDIRLEEIPAAIRGSIERVLALSPTATSQNVDGDARSLPIARLRITTSDRECDEDTGGMNSSGFLSVYVKAPGEVGMRLIEVERLPIGPSQSTGCLFYGKKQTLLEDGVSREKADQQAWIDTSSKLKSRLEEMKPVPPDDPNLMREITHRAVGSADESTLTRHLRGLARETGLNIMFETFSNAQTFCGSVPERGTIRDILQAITRMSGLIWEKKGNTVFLRYPDWAKKRSLEVQSLLLAEWEQKAKADKGLTFRTMQDIVSKTTYDQRKQTLARNDVLRGCGINKTFSGAIQISLVTLLRLSDSESKNKFVTVGLPVTLLRKLNYSNEHLDEYVESLAKYPDDAIIGTSVNTLGKEDQRGQQAISLFYSSKRESNKTLMMDYTVAYSTASKLLNNIEEPKEQKRKTGGGLQ